MKSTKNYIRNLILKEVKLLTYTITYWWYGKPIEKVSGLDEYDKMCAEKMNERNKNFNNPCYYEIIPEIKNE